MSTRSGKRLRSPLEAVASKSKSKSTHKHKTSAQNQSDTHNQSKRFKQRQQTNTANQPAELNFDLPADSPTLNNDQN